MLDDLEDVALWQSETGLGICLTTQSCQTSLLIP